MKMKTMLLLVGVLLLAGATFAFEFDPETWLDTSGTQILLYEFVNKQASHIWVVNQITPYCNTILVSRPCTPNPLYMPQTSLLFKLIQLKCRVHDQYNHRWLTYGDFLWLCVIEICAKVNCPAIVCPPFGVVMMAEKQGIDLVSLCCPSCKLLIWRTWQFRWRWVNWLNIVFMYTLYNIICWCFII